jgi:thiamine-phosphate pyrophosphorylase
MRSEFPPGLLLITDRAQARRPLVEIADAALAAGFAAVMLREKELSGREAYELAAALMATCARHGRPLIVNDRVDVALALAAAHPESPVGAHVGRTGIPVADARSLLGPDRVLGYSAHEAEEARGALHAGAAYVTLSPIYASASKPAYAARGVAWLREALRIVPPARAIALGGVTADVLPELRGLGIGGAAVMGEIMRAEYPARVAAEMAREWGPSPPRDPEPTA